MRPGTSSEWSRRKNSSRSSEPEPVVAREQINKLLLIINK
jgi:hypothetical protein